MRVSGKAKGLRRSEGLLWAGRSLVADRKREAGAGRECSSRTRTRASAGDGHRVGGIAALPDGRRCAAAAATGERSHAEGQQSEGCKRTEIAPAAERNQAKQHGQQ